MDITKCKICFNQYNELKHRPRTLGCGHYFCERCIDNIISSGKPKCPICQQTITVKTASEAIVNFAIEELLQNVKFSDAKSASTEQTSMPILGLCPKHSSCRLNFVCMTHNIKVCRDCTVLDHKLDKCNVISFEDEIELKKKNTLSSINLLLNSLKDAQQSLESHIESNDLEIGTIKSKIEAIQLQIIKFQETMKNINTSQLSAKDILSKIKIKQEELQKAMFSLQDMTSVSELMTSIEDPIKKMNEVQIWEVDIRKEYNLMSPLYISTLIKKFPAGVYTTENAGEFNRSARILETNGKVHLLALRKQTLPKEAYTLPLLALERLFTTDYSDVFICLLNNESKLGVLYIRVVNSEYGRYFRNICCGTYGPSYRGVHLTLETPISTTPQPVHPTGGIFSNKFGGAPTPAFNFGSVNDLRCIGCKHPLNEDGTFYIKQFNQISVANEIKENIKQGKVYVFGNGGFIISQANLPIQGIPIGEVLQGMEVIQTARNYLCQQQLSIHGISSIHCQTQNKLKISGIGMVLFNQE